MNQRGTWQLILMAREGDRNAIDELIFASFPSTYLILFNILGEKDAVLSVLSKVYAETFLNLDKLEKSEEFFEVIHKKAIEQMLSYEKCKITLNHDKSLCEKASEFSDDTACFYDFNTIKDIDASSTADCIFTVLNTLSLEKRICLYLYYFVSTSPEVIASIVSSDEEQVKGTLVSAFSEAAPILRKVCEKSDFLENINEKSVILWANRNTKEFSLSPEEMESFYSSVIKSLVDSSFVDAPIAGDTGIVDDKLEVKSMKLTKNKDFLKSVFNLKNFLIFLIAAAVAGIVFAMNQLDEYNKRRQEREALTNRTTLSYTTRAPSSEKVIFSTEYIFTDVVSETDAAEDNTESNVDSPDVTANSTTKKKEETDFLYTESSSAVTITGYTGTAINITIPEKINGKPVTAIGDSAFFDSNIVNVNIPSTVKTIGQNAFHSCVALGAIKLPIGVTTIGNGAFRGCTNLSSVSLPSTLVKIGSQAFYKCTALKSIALPSALTSIEDWAFAYCSMLSNITIPKSVTKVGASVFYECRTLSRCTFETMSKVNELGESFFFSCTSLETVTLPQNVKVIPANCFYGCRSLKTVPLIAVTHINESAFEGCSSLTSVNFSTALLKIEKSAFSGCSSLNNVKLPPNTLSIGERAFAGCTGMSNIYIPASVTKIGVDAFADCVILSIDCPENSSAYKYAKENGIKLYGNDSSANDM